MFSGEGDDGDDQDAAGDAAPDDNAAALAVTDVVRAGADDRSAFGRERFLKWHIAGGGDGVMLGVAVAVAETDGDHANDVDEGVAFADVDNDDDADDDADDADDDGDDDDDVAGDNGDR